MINLKAKEKSELLNHIETSIGFILSEMSELERKIKADKNSQYGVSVKDLADYQRYASCFENMAKGFDSLLKVGD